MNLAAYIPVIHQGYLNWFNQHRGSNLYVLGRELIEELRDGHVEIRAVDPEMIADIIRSLGWFASVEILTPPMLPEVVSQQLVMPREVISKRFYMKYVYNGSGSEPGAIEESVFLRWDSGNIASHHLASYDRVSHDQTDRALMTRAYLEADNSADWWRQVGAVVVRDGQVLLGACNNHVPSPETPYALGDPRDFVQAGTNPEINTTLHAEQAIITRAAREGIALEGCRLYVTVFPCPMCAKQIAYSGINQVFFATGHASLDGDNILKDCGVSLTKVDMTAT